MIGMDGKRELGDSVLSVKMMMMGRSILLSVSINLVRKESYFVKTWT